MTKKFVKILFVVYSLSKKNINDCKLCASTNNSTSLVINMCLSRPNSCAGRSIVSAIVISWAIADIEVAKLPITWTKWFVGMRWQRRVLTDEMLHHIAIIGGYSLACSNCIIWQHEVRASSVTRYPSISKQPCEPLIRKRST